MIKEIKYWVFFVLILLGSSLIVYNFFVKGKYISSTKVQKIITPDGEKELGEAKKLKIPVSKERYVLFTVEKDVDQNGFNEQIVVTVDPVKPNDGLQIDFITYDPQIKNFSTSGSMLSSIDSYQDVQHRFLPEQSSFLLAGMADNKKYFLEQYEIKKDSKTGLLSIFLKTIYESDIRPVFLAKDQIFELNPSLNVNGLGFVLFTIKDKSKSIYYKKFFKYEESSFSMSAQAEGLFIADNDIAYNNIGGFDFSLLSGIWIKDENSAFDMVTFDTEKMTISLLKDHLLENYKWSRSSVSENFIYIEAINEAVNTVEEEYKTYFSIILTSPESIKIDIKWKHDEEVAYLKKISQTESTQLSRVESSRFEEHPENIIGTFDDIQLDVRYIFDEDGHFSRIEKNNVFNGRYICYQWNNSDILEMADFDTINKSVYQVMKDKDNDVGVKLVPVKITSMGLTYLSQKPKNLIQIIE